MTMLMSIFLSVMVMMFVVMMVMRVGHAIPFQQMETVKLSEIIYSKSIAYRKVPIAPVGNSAQNVAWNPNLIGAELPINYLSSACI